MKETAVKSPAKKVKSTKTTATKIAPARDQKFDKLHKDFVTNGYAVARGIIEPQTCRVLAEQFRMHRRCSYFYRNAPLEHVRAFEDGQVPYSFPHYGFYAFEALMVEMQPAMEIVIGKKLHPCYTYARIMYAGADMKVHKDRPSCQFSTTACIDYDVKDPYPIYIKNYAGKTSAVTLAPGDMLVYHGTDLEHWREEYTGREHIQAFLHYVDARGKYKDYKFDHRPMLGLSADTKSGQD
jgi:hypothetical protein